MKYQVLIRNRSVVNLPEIEHHVAILDAKQGLERIQQAVREWRNKKELDTYNVNDSGRDSISTRSYTNCEQNQDNSKTALNTLNNLSWTKRDEFRPLMVPEINNQPVRKCFSEFLLCGDRAVPSGTGVSVGDIFQEASMLLRKESTNTNAAANMIRYLKPWGAETKHYNTPNHSVMNSPRDDLAWQGIQEELAHQGDGRRVLQESPEVSQGMTSPHVSKSSMGGDSAKQRRALQDDDDEDLDKIHSMPYCHGRCGIVEVLPTIMEKTSPIASSSQRSSVSSSRSDENHQPKNALITVKKGANTSALSKCSLCERFGSNSQIIFSIDNVKYTFSKNGQNRLEPYRDRNGAKEKNNTKYDSKVEYLTSEKSNNVNSSAGPYTRYENQNVRFPPLQPLSDNSRSSQQEHQEKSKHPPRVSLPPLMPQQLSSDRKMRLSDVCRADYKKLPPIPGHIVLKRKRKVQNQKEDMQKGRASMLNGGKLPPLQLPEVNGWAKNSKQQKYQGYHSPLDESVRNNSRCDDVAEFPEVLETGKLETGTNKVFERNGKPSEEPIHLLVRVPTMEATVLDTQQTTRKRKGSKTRKH